MKEENIISGRNEAEVWQQINAQFLAHPEPLEYSAVIEQENRKVLLDIDIDLGGGFESGYELTTFTAHLHSSPSFRFAMHEKHFTDEIGKFFGMEDIEIGFDEFDDKLIIKTNDKLRVREIFSEASVRAVFLSLTDFSFGITHHHSSGQVHDEPFLELQIEVGITDPVTLREIYNAFYAVLSNIDPVDSTNT